MKDEKAESCAGCRFYDGRTITSDCMQTEMGREFKVTLLIQVPHCRRFPLHESKTPDDWCGEFSAKTS